MNPPSEFSAEKQVVTETPRRALLPHAMIYMFLNCFHGGAEGINGNERMAFLFDIYIGTFSNYLCHVTFVLFDGLVVNLLAQFF